MCQTFDFKFELPRFLASGCGDGEPVDVAGVGDGDASLMDRGQGGNAVRQRQSGRPGADGLVGESGRADHADQQDRNGEG